jgi:hypothetical protein
LIPQIELATIPLELSSRSAHTLASAASHEPANSAGDRKRRRIETAKLLGGVTIGGALAAPLVRACQDVVRHAELRERADERARHEKLKKRSAAGSTLNEVYENARSTNVVTLTELLRGDSAGTFLDDLYRSFARGNELLRHFWGAFPVINRASLAKATRVAGAVHNLSVELDASVEAIPLALKGRLTPMLIELRARLDCALARFDETNQVLAKRGIVLK